MTTKHILLVHKSIVILTLHEDPEKCATRKSFLKRNDRVYALANSFYP